MTSCGAVASWFETDKIAPLKLAGHLENIELDILAVKQMFDRCADSENVFYLITTSWGPDEHFFMNVDSLCYYRKEWYYILDLFYTQAKTFLAERCKFNFARALVMMACIMQDCTMCSYHDIKELAVRLEKHTVSPTEFNEELPFCRRGLEATVSIETMKSHLDSYCFKKYVSLWKDMEFLFYINFCNGDQEICVAVNPLVRVETLVKLFVRDNSFEGKPIQIKSLRLYSDGVRLFMSTSGRKSLYGLGITEKFVIEDGSIIDFEVVETESEECTDYNHQNSAKYDKKQPTILEKAMAAAKPNQKPRRTHICNHQTKEDDFRIAHSKQMTSIFEEADSIFKQLRQKIYSADIQKFTSKDKTTIVAKKEKTTKDDNGPHAIPEENLGGKAGKIFFSVVVGDIEHLYSSTKPSHLRSNKSQHLDKKSHVIDLHGHTVAEALRKLDEMLPEWINDAMTGDYPWTINLTIICGGGSQILSEAVEGWIRANKGVAIRPKGS